MSELPAGDNQVNGDDLLWQQLKTLPAFRALLRAVEARFYQNIDFPQPALDVGCGDGHFAQMTFDHPLQVGIDPWWGPLQKAVKSDTYSLPLQALGDNLPFPDNCFASAFSNSVLEHIPDIQPVLDEVGRVLQIDAPFVITVPSHFFTEYLGGAQFFERIGLNGAAGSYRKLFNQISRHAHTDAPEIWAKRLAQAGFQIERWQYYFSRKALHTLELGHAQGVPSAVLHALTGHWIIGPWESNLQWTERWVRPYYEEEFPEEGAYIFFLARKASDGPLATELPAAKPFAVAELYGSEPINLPEAAAAVSPLSAGVAGEDREKGGDDTGTTEPLRDEPAAEALSQSSSKPREAQKPSRRRWLFFLALFLTLLAPRFVASGSSPGLFIALIVWMIAVVVAFYALYEPQDIASLKRRKIPRFTLVTSILLFLVALVVRLYDLGQHPFILNGTEASLGIDVMRVINGTLRNPFSTGWLTNPTLPLFLLAVPLKLLGPSAVALRLLSPFVGAITVVATFLIGQRLYGRAVGLVAAVLLLGSYFHLHFSRLGLTNAWDALLVLLSLGLIAIAWQRKASKSRLKWLLAGLAVGSSTYFYTSSHLLPLMLVALLALTLIFDWERWQEQWRNVVAMTALALIIALPQIVGYWGNPGIFMDRANTLGILESQNGWLGREAVLTSASQMQIIGQQLWSAALAFNGTVDTGTSFGPLKPLMNFVSGLLAVFGFVLAVIRLRKLTYSILVVWIAATIIFAGALLVEPPNSHRFIIAAPAVNLLAAIGMVELISALFNRSDEEQIEAAGGISWYQRKVFLILVPLVIAAAIAISDIGFYFGSYRNEHQFADRNTEIADVLADYLNSLEGDWSAYFYGPPSMYVDFPTIPFLATSFQKDRNLFDIVEPDAELALTDSANHVFIYLPERYDEIAVAKMGFSSGQEQRFDGYYAEPLFHAYEIRERANLED